MDTREKITKMYHELLCRNPDEEGLSFYVEKLENHDLTMDDVESILKSSKEYLQKQQVESKPDLFNLPNKLNLGCGFDKRKNYLNVDFQDFHKPDLVADITNLNMLPSNYFEEIIAQDVLEHFPRKDTLKVLSEWSRLLKSGGIIKLRVPNLLGLLSLFVDKQFESVEGHNRLVHNLFGTQAYSGDWHYTGFTKIILDDFLKRAGFVNVEYQDKDRWLFEIVAKKN